jgi:hypothetical protein
MYGEIPDPHFALQVIDDVILPLATAPGVAADRQPTTSLPRVETRKNR